MGKLSVFIFAALAAQAVIGGQTSGFGDDHEEHSNLFRQFVSVSDDIYHIFHSTLFQHDSFWEINDFHQELEEVIAYLEELDTKHDDHKSGISFNILQVLREVRSYCKQLMTCTDSTTRRKLENDFALTIKKVVKCMASFEEIFSKDQFSDTFYSDIQTFLSKFVIALRNLHKNINVHKMTNLEDVYPSMHHFNGDEKTPEYYKDKNGIHEITTELKVTLERVHFDDDLMNRAFKHLVRRYFENLQEVLTPELLQYYEMFVHTKDFLYSVQEVKTHMYTFIEKFVSKLDQMPETTYVAFVKATRKFENRLNILTVVNTPERQLAIRIQTFADLFTNWYETLPYHTSEFKGILNEHAPQLAETLQRFISKIEKTQTHHELVFNLKRSISHFEQQTVQQKAFVVVIQEFTTEVRKFLISRPEATKIKVLVGTEFLNILEWIAAAYDKVYNSANVEIWYPYLKAQINKFSLYMHNDMNSEDMSLLMKNLDHVSALLEHSPNTEFKKLSDALKEAKRELQTDGYMINNILQKLALEFNQFIWTLSEQNQRATKDGLDILNLFMKRLETIFFNQRVVRGFLTAQTPVELTLKAEAVVDRLTKMLHLMVPGFKHAKIAHRVRYFNGILEVVMFRLRKISFGYEKSDELIKIKSVYGNLRDIQGHLQAVLEQPNLNTNVNFGVYIYKAVQQLRKLPFEQNIEGHAEFIKMYGDFLFGLEYLVNQIQFDLQIIVQQYSIRTLNLQIETVAYTISGYLQSIQAKPELKQVVLLQMEALAQIVKPLAYSLRIISANRTFSKLFLKYGKLYDDLREVAKMDCNKSVEDLTAFLDMNINTIVHDLRRLTPYGQETPEIHEVYKNVLNVFCNIMARLENIYYYEYYHILVKTPDFVGVARRLTNNVLTKLQKTIAKSEEIKYNLALQAMKFAHRLKNIALRVQIEDKVFPKGLFNIVSNLQSIGNIESIGVNEIRTNLSKGVIAVYTEMENIASHENNVGLKEAGIKCLVALDRLYFDVHNILVRSHYDGSFQTTFIRIDTYVHYLTKTIEHVDSENAVAFSILRTEYLRLFNFIKVLSEKCNKSQLNEIEIVETEDDNNVDKLKVSIIENLRQVVVDLKELAWVLPDIQHQGQDAYVTFQTFFDAFLTTVQRMDIEIDIAALTHQKVYTWTKPNGHLVKNYGHFPRGDNEYTSKYDEKYYETFAKYFNNPKGQNGPENATKTTSSYRHSGHALHQYEISGFFGKYTNEDEALTKDLQNSFQHIRSITQEVTKELHEIPLNSLTVYVRKLVQIVASVIHHLEQQHNQDDTIKQVIEKFQKIKVQLKQMIGFTVSYQPSQIKYELCSAIEQIIDQFEKLAVSQVGFVKEVFQQFFNDIQHIQYQIKNNVHNREDKENLTTTTSTRL